MCKEKCLPRQRCYSESNQHRYTNLQISNTFVRKSHQEGSSVNRLFSHIIFQIIVAQKPISQVLQDRNLSAPSRDHHSRCLKNWERTREINFSWKFSGKHQAFRSQNLPRKNRLIRKSIDILSPLTQAVIFLSPCIAKYRSMLAKTIEIEKKNHS